MSPLDSCAQNYTAKPAPVHGAIGLGASPKLHEAVSERPTAAVGRALTEGEAAILTEMLSLVRVRSLADAITIRNGIASVCLPLLPMADMALFDAARVQAVADGCDLPVEAPSEAEAEPLERVRRAQDPTGLGLTGRQRDVLARLSAGKPNSEIACELGMCVGTVKIHVTAILKALGATNRTQAVIRAAELGITGADLTARGA